MLSSKLDVTATTKAVAIIPGVIEAAATVARGKAGPDREGQGLRDEGSAET